MSKIKGNRTERELFHLFWNNGWAIVRAAGSGSTPLPAPDLIASNSKKTLAIECKAIRKGKRYLDKAEIEQLELFSKTFGAEPWIGIRFDNTDWHFVQPKHIEKSKNGNYVLSKNLINKKGIKFEELVGRYKQHKLYK